MQGKYFIKRTGFINASGNDLIDFINRMSTNDLRKFPENEMRKTVLTTDKGRIIDLISIFNLNEKKFIQTAFENQDKVTGHLEKFIIMDDVVLEKSDSQYFHIIISGDVISLSESLLNIKPEKNKVYLINGNNYMYFDDFKLNTLNIICKETDLEKYKKMLKEMHEQSVEEYEYDRINAGIPEGENEFNDNVNPMECGLDKYISFNKGCYIGQEVIARLDSQGKLPKRMVRINSEETLHKDDKIFLSDEEKETGFVSSSAAYNGDNISLGFIRSVNLGTEKEYYAVHNDNPAEKIKLKISNI